jgi:hypothetical protein
MVTQAVIAEVGPVADLPAERATAHAETMDEVREKQTAADAAHTAYIVRQAQTEQQRRALWLKLRSWYAVAKVTAPAGAKAGLSGIDTSLAFTTAHVRKRAEQTRAVLSAFPADYNAGGMTAAQLNTSITELLAAEESEQALMTAWRNAQSALKEVDAALDKENKALYQLLVVSFPEGSLEREVIGGIPTSTPARAAEPKQPPAEVKG